MLWSAVIVEGNFSDVWKYVPAFGKKTAATNAKIVFRSIMAFQNDYKVPWIFCESRREAEVYCFRLFERFIRKQREEENRLKKILKGIEDI